MHSSRVGASINACVFVELGSITLSKGKPKAAVLPVPVCASATISALRFNKIATVFLVSVLDS